MPLALRPSTYLDSSFTPVLGHLNNYIANNPSKVKEFTERTDNFLDAHSSVLFALKELAHSPLKDKKALEVYLQNFMLLQFARYFPEIDIPIPSVLPTLSPEKISQLEKHLASSHKRFTQLERKAIEDNMQSLKQQRKALSLFSPKRQEMSAQIGSLEDRKEHIKEALTAGFQQATKDLTTYQQCIAPLGEIIYDATILNNTYLNKLAVIIPEFNPQERAVNSQPLNEKKLKSFLEKYASLIDSASSGKLKETSHIMYFIRQQWNATFKEPHLQIPQEELNL